jgi:hypothetical protein
MSGTGCGYNSQTGDRYNRERDAGGEVSPCRERVFYSLFLHVRFFF